MARDATSDALDARLDATEDNTLASDVLIDTANDVANDTANDIATDVHTFDAAPDASISTCAVVSGTCSDGRDDDDDGLIDCADPDCAQSCGVNIAPGVYEVVYTSSGGVPERLDLRSDRTCRLFADRSWRDCTWALNTNVSPASLQLRDTNGALTADWTVTQEGDVVHVTVVDQAWRTLSYAIPRPLPGSTETYVSFGGLEDGASLEYSSNRRTGWNVVMRAGDRIVIASRLSQPPGPSGARLYGPRVSDTDIGPLLPTPTDTLAGYPVVAAAPSDGTYTLLYGGGGFLNLVQTHRFDASGRPYRFMFTRGRDLSAQIETSGAAVGDVTGDHRNDLIIANGTLGRGGVPCAIQIYTGMSGGGVSNMPTSTLMPPGRCSRGVIDMYVVDADRNGWNDLITFNGEQLLVALASSTGVLTALTPATTDPTYGIWARMVVLRADDDNFPDVAIATSSGSFDAGLLRVYLNDGSGGFGLTRTVHTMSNGRHSIGAGDLNGDGLDDVAIGSGQGRGRNVDVVLGGSDVALALSGYTNPTQNGNLSTETIVGVGDLSCDSRAELLVSTIAYDEVFSFSSTGEMNRLARFEQLHGQIFANADERAGNEIFGHTSSDFYFYRRTEAGWRISRYQLPSTLNYETQNLAIGDFDGDGCLDAVLPSLNLGTTLLPGLGCRR